MVGAGMAGLACAVALTARGRPVALYEAAGHAGGRCRSFHDDRVGREVDNGNHLILTGNESVNAYLSRIGSEDAFWTPPRAAFPFVDLKSGQRWTVAPDHGRIPWRLLAGPGRVPGAGLGEYLRALGLARAADGETVSQSLGGPGVLYGRFWHPLALAVLNTDPSEAAAQLMWPVLRETFGRGESACRPRVALEGLSHALVTPAVAWVRNKGVAVRFSARLRALHLSDTRVVGLGFGDIGVPVGDDDGVVLALPPSVARELLPGIVAPESHRPIVNAHFRLPAEGSAISVLGILGGTAQWLFQRNGIASVTVSAATDLVDLPVEALAKTLWRDVAQALHLDESPIPPHRVVKERRATFAQTPAELRRRPGPRTPWHNLLLAGDWTDTGLPATIEGAVRSGDAAASILSPHGTRS